MSRREEQLRAGALECIKALATLEHSAESLPREADDAATFYSIQAVDAEVLAKAFGPLTPRQQGAFRTLAEYIHFDITTGGPNLTYWRPVVSMAPSELADKIAKCEEDNNTGAQQG